MLNSQLFPPLSLTARTSLMDISPEGCIPTVIDSDTFNEIDDQYAIAWAMLNHKRINLQAVYAAPFTNSMFTDNHHRVEEAKIGMELSYKEIHNIIKKVKTSASLPKICRGSTQYLKDSKKPLRSEAVDDLIQRAQDCPTNLQVICIGAPTNIANALLIEPKLIEKIHIIWLGGHSFDWCHTEEFNLMQDIDASRTLLDSGAALTLIPCNGVANTLASSVPELEYYLKGKNPLADFLASESSKCPWVGFGNRKVIWDIAPVGYILNPDWYICNMTASPILNDNFTWSFHPKRHLIRVVKFIERDALFINLFTKLIHH